MAYKLTEECTVNVEEAKLAKITWMELHLTETENKRKCSSCLLYIALFSIILTIIIGTGTYFIYFHWYLKRKIFVLSLVPALKQQLNKLINEKKQINRDQKSNLLFLQRHN